MSDTTDAVDKPKRSRGRPSSLGKIIYEIDGRLITAKERIPELMRAGMFLEPASSCAGVFPSTVHDWLRVGALAFNQKHTAEQLDMPLSLTPHQQACMEFNEAVTRSVAEYELECTIIQGQLIRGGLKTTKTTVKRGPPKLVNGKSQPGDIIEESTVTEVLAPNPTVLAWRMTRRWPDRYGNRLTLDGATDGQVTDEDAAEQLIGSIEEFLGADQPAE